MEYTQKDVDRFAEKVNIPDDTLDKGLCWIWVGAQHGEGRGYGKFHLDGRTMSAHRASYLLFNGPIKPGMVIDHTCVNERCVSPHHLEQCTQAVNIKLTVTRGTHASCRRKAA